MGPGTPRSLLLICGRSRERLIHLTGFGNVWRPSKLGVCKRPRDGLHEIKHDGFRMMALRDSAGVRLWPELSFGPTSW